jgi:hypothetical protein
MDDRSENRRHIEAELFLGVAFASCATSLVNEPKVYPLHALAKSDGCMLLVDLPCFSFLTIWLSGIGVIWAAVNVGLIFRST